MLQYGLRKQSLVPRLLRLARNPWSVGFRALNNRFWDAAGADNRPAFHSIDDVFPCLRLLDTNYSVIRQELQLVMEYGRIPQYHELAESERYISGTVHPEKSWKVFMLHSPAGRPRANQRRCPLTCALLDQLPNLYQAFFSILDPGKSIPAHSGTYYGYLRYHLALVVPPRRPPSMRVKDQVHVWQEGRSILFDDSWEHEVYNESDGLRAVLIVDLLRPLPLRLHLANWLATRLLMRHSEEAKQVRTQLKRRFS